MLGPCTVRAIADADSAAFEHAIFLTVDIKGLDRLSIKERVLHTEGALRSALPSDVPAALTILCDMETYLTGGFQSVAVSEYAARFGFVHVRYCAEACY